MRLIKKMAAAFLVTVMAIFMTVPVLAAEGPYDSSITITNTNEDHVYTAYQIFEGRLEQDALSKEYILSDIEWGSGIEPSKEIGGSDLIAALKSDALIGSSFSADSYTAAEVAEVLKSFEENSSELDAFASVVSKYLSATGTESVYSGGNQTISGLEAGYYLVKDSKTEPDEGEPEHDAYSKFILKLTTDITVSPKSSVPTVEKKVYDDGYGNNDSGTNGNYSYGAGYNDIADWNIGDEVSFKLFGTMPSTLDDYDTYSYSFHDKLSAGLTYKEGSAAVALVNPSDGVYGGTDGVSFEDGVDITGNFKVSASGNQLLISCDDVTGIADLNSNSLIVVEYTAVLNSNAVTGPEGNRNEVYLEFSNNPNQDGAGETGTTPTDQVIVFTYELGVTKVDGEDLTTTLKDAEFVLYKKVGDAEHYYKIENAGSGSPVVSWTDKAEEAEKLTSDEEGYFSVRGLDAGTYYLRELTSPEGYNLLEDDVEVVITAVKANGQNWTGTASEALTALSVRVNEPAVADDTREDDNGTLYIKVKNFPGASLPETGGTGTTIFYIAGGALVIIAGLILIVRRRTRSDK